MDKKKLYESIMKQVSIEIKKVLNENDNNPFEVPEQTEGQKAANDLFDAIITNKELISELQEISKNKNDWSDFRTRFIKLINGGSIPMD